MVLIERDLTAQNGIVATLLPDGFGWRREFDIDNKRRHTSGYDGWLCFNGACLPCEVKVGEGSLASSERVAEQWFRERGIRYVILRWFGSPGKADFWRLEVSGQAWVGSLIECLKGLQ